MKCRRSDGDEKLMTIVKGHLRESIILDMLVFASSKVGNNNFIVDVFINTKYKKKLHRKDRYIGFKRLNDLILILFTSAKHANTLIHYHSIDDYSSSYLNSLILLP